MPAKPAAVTVDYGRAEPQVLWCERVRRLATFGLMFALIGMPGCAGWSGGGWTSTGWKRPKPTVPDVKPLREDRAKEAIAEFERERNSAQYLTAMTCWKQGNVPGCRERLEKLLVREPGNRPALMLMAEVHLVNEEFDKAQAIVQKLIDQDPKNAQALHTLGLILEVQGEQREAVACYERAVQLAPDDMAIATSYEAAVETLDNEGQTPRASVRSQVKATAFASDADHSAHVRNTDSGNVSNVKILQGSAGFKAQELSKDCRDSLQQGVEALEGKDFDMFLNCARAAMQAQPRDPKVPNLAAVSALRHNQPELAVQLAEEGIHTVDGTAELYRTLGAAQYRLGQYTEAQVSLGKSLSLDKSNALAYFLMGCTLNKLGEHEKADEHLQRARQIDPRYQAGERSAE